VDANDFCRDGACPVSRLKRRGKPRLYPAYPLSHSKGTKIGSLAYS
jgi:hypothetical protein